MVAWIFALQGLVLMSVVWGECNITCDRLGEMPAKWRYEQKDIPYVALMCSVNSRCRLDAFWLLQNHTKPDELNASTYVNVDMYFTCQTEQKFDFSETVTADGSLLASIRLANCNTSWEDVSHIGKVFSLLEVEMVINATYPLLPTNAQSTLPGLEELRYIFITFANLERSVVIDDVLPYREKKIKTLVSLILQCESGSTINSTIPRKYCSGKEVSLNTSLLKALYPHLQILSLNGVYITDQRDKLHFPWHDASVDLPFNLSRSNFRQKLVTNGYVDRVGNQKFIRLLSINGTELVAVEKICPSYEQLNTIIFNSNGLRHIPLDCFTPGDDQTSNLYYLSLTNNPLNHLTVGTFSRLFNLDALHLRHCELVELQDGLFDDLTNLKLLDLSYNLVTKLSAGIFSRLDSLQNLFLQHNRLDTIDYPSFPTYSSNLYFVDLRQNELRTFPYDCLTLPSLHLCDCDHNQISLNNFSDIMYYFQPVRMYFVQPLAIYGETYNPSDIGIMHENNQAKISLRANYINRITFGNEWTTDAKRQLAATLSFYQFNLEFIDVSSAFMCDCDLYYLQRFILNEAADSIKGALYSGSVLLTPSNFQSWKCQGYDVLEANVDIKPFLDVAPENFLCRDNGSVLMCPQYCVCYQRAHNSDLVVDCASKSLQSVPKNVQLPKDGGQLLVSLERNDITRLPSCKEPGYEWLAVVTMLNMEHNEITPKSPDDTENFLDCITKVQRLYLAYNNIKYLPSSIMNKNYTNLTISGNKLTCDCGMYWMKGWLQEKSASIVHSQIIHCEGIAIAIVTMKKDQFKCDGILAYIGTVAGLVCLVVAVIIFSLSLYVYRFEVKVLLFEKLNWHPFDNQEEDSNKEHDVFLMYSEEDELWAVNTLLVGLKQFGYTTCIPDRDFRVGASTAEEMATAFSKTHRVLVVISQNFINNVHAMSDFYHAYEHDRSGSRKRFLVLIKLREKIDFKQHNIFKKYLSTNYFLPIHSRAFWFRLRYWLPPLQDHQLPDVMDNIPTAEMEDEELQELQQEDGARLLPREM